MSKFGTFYRKKCQDRTPSSRSAVISKTYFSKDMLSFHVGGGPTLPFLKRPTHIYLKLASEPPVASAYLVRSSLMCVKRKRRDSQEGLWFSSTCSKKGGGGLKRPGRCQCTHLCAAAAAKQKHPSSYTLLDDLILFKDITHMCPRCSGFSQRTFPQAFL